VAHLSIRIIRATELVEPLGQGSRLRRFAGLYLPSLPYARLERSVAVPPPQPLWDCPGRDQTEMTARAMRSPSTASPAWTFPIDGSGGGGGLRSDRHRGETGRALARGDPLRKWHGQVEDQLRTFRRERASFAVPVPPPFGYVIASGVAMIPRVPPLKASAVGARDPLVVLPVNGGKLCSRAYPCSGSKSSGGPEKISARSLTPGEVQCLLEKDAR